MSDFTGPTAPIPEEVNHVSGQVVDAALAVHRILGAGLLERVYEECLCMELKERGLQLERQLEIPVQYRGVTLGTGFRVDLLVEQCVVVELKAVEVVLAVHQAQMLTYLKLSGHRVGLLINFNVLRIKSAFIGLFSDQNDRGLAGAATESGSRASKGALRVPLCLCVSVVASKGRP